MAAKAKNTMSAKDFRRLVFTAFILSLSLFFPFFFEPLGRITAGQSVYVFLILQFGFSLSATILLHKKKRTVLNAVIVVLLPQFIYRGLSTGNIVLSVVGVALLWLFSLTFFCESFFRRKDPLEKLTDEERLDVLTYILNMETKHLGITLPIKLITSRQMPDDTLGSYHPADGTIEINESLVMKKYPDSAGLGSVLAHEAFHVLQFECLLLSNEENLSALSAEDSMMAKRVEYEFVNYKPCAEAGLQAYQNQLIERQARSYAKRRKKFYQQHLPGIVEEFKKQTKKQEGAADE